MNKEKETPKELRSRTESMFDNLTFHNSILAMEGCRKSICNGFVSYAVYNFCTEQTAWAIREIKKMARKTGLRLCIMYDIKEDRKRYWEYRRGGGSICNLQRRRRADDGSKKACVNDYDGYGCCKSKITTILLFKEAKDGS